MIFFPSKKSIPVTEPGFIDGVKDRRKGLIYLNHSEFDSYSIILKNDKDRLGNNTLLEVEEIFNDKTMSKVRIVNVAWTRCASKELLSKFNPWIDSDKIYWLSPSVQVDRDNKLNDILK